MMMGRLKRIQVSPEFLVMHMTYGVRSASISDALPPGCKVLSSYVDHNDVINIIVEHLIFEEFTFDSREEIPVHTVTFHAKDELSTDKVKFREFL